MIDPWALSPPPPLRPSFRAKVLIGAGLEVGEFGGGRKRIVPILGGAIEGRLTAEIMPGGADWQIIRPSGVTEVWARYTLRADDGAIVIITNPGLRRAPPEVSARLAAGERVDPSLYYFRASPVFETGAAAHRWLTEATFVCVGERWPDSVMLNFFEVG